MPKEKKHRERKEKESSGGYHAIYWGIIIILLLLVGALYFWPKSNHSIPFTEGVDQDFAVDTNASYNIVYLAFESASADPRAFAILDANPWINTTAQFLAYIAANETAWGVSWAQINIGTFANATAILNYSAPDAAIDGYNATIWEPEVFILYSMYITVDYANLSWWNDIDFNVTTWAGVNASDYINTLKNIGQPFVNRVPEALSIFVMSVDTTAPNPGHNCTVLLKINGVNTVVDGDF